jgi:hypothetical protein
MKKVDDQAESDPFGAGEWARKKAYGFDPEPDDPVFEALAH